MTSKNLHPAATILVLGGHGFIGRYTVDALSHMGANVLVGTRGLSRRSVRGAGASSKRSEKLGPRIKRAERRIVLHESLNVGDWNTVLQGVDAVVNCVGIMRERPGETFYAVHHLAVAALAKACALKNIPLVHMSALGITQAINPYTMSKLMGEQAILNSGAHASIVRASVVDAADGYGAGWFYKLAQWPIWLLPEKATRYLSPVKAPDLGRALALLALESLQSSPKSRDRLAKILEVGCGEWFTLESYLERLRNPVKAGAKAPLVVRIPQALARAMAVLCDWLNITAYSEGHHDLLEHNNVPSVNHLPEILGHDPTPITQASVVPNYTADKGCLNTGKQIVENNHES